MKNTIAFSAAVSLLVPLAASAAAPTLPLSPIRSHVRGVARVPLQLDGGMPVVEVSLDESGPYRFAIDTSVRESLVIDKALVKKLGLTGPVDRVRLGDATFDGVNATVDDTRERFNVDGLIGFGLLSEVLVTFDYNKAELRITKGALPATMSSVRPLTLTDGKPAIVIQAGGRYMFATINTEAAESMTVPSADTLPTIGNAFFKNVVVTFDAAHRRVAIEEATSDRRSS